MLLQHIAFPRALILARNSLSLILCFRHCSQTIWTYRIRTNSLCLFSFWMCNAILAWIRALLYTYTKLMRCLVQCCCALFVWERRQLNGHLYICSCIISKKYVVSSAFLRAGCFYWIYRRYVTRYNIYDVIHQFMLLSSSHYSTSQRYISSLITVLLVQEPTEILPRPHWGFINSLLRIRSNNFETDSILYHRDELGSIGTIRKALRTTRQ